MNPRFGPIDDSGSHQQSKLSLYLFIIYESELLYGINH